MQQRVSLCRWFTEHKPELLASAVSGLLCFGYAFTNKLVSHDDVFYLFSKGESIAQGRWGLTLLSSLLPDVSLPWLWGLLSLLMIAVSCALMLDICGVRNRTARVTAAAVMTVSPVFISLFAYMFMSTPYTLALMLTTLGITVHLRKERWAKPLAAILIAISLSLYQAFITVAAVLMLCRLIRLCIESDKSWNVILAEAFMELALLILSIALYALLTFLVLTLTGLPLNAYAAGAFSGSGILQRITDAYYSFYLECVQGFYGLVLTKPVRIVHLLLLALSSLMLFVSALQKKRPMHLVLMLLFLALIPLAVNGMLLAAEGSAVHTLVVCGFGCIGLLGAMAIDLMPTLPAARVLSCALALCMLFIAFRNTVSGNTAFLYMETAQRGQAAFYSSLLSRLDEAEGYRPGMPVALLGDASGNFPEDERWGEVTRLSGIDGLRRYDEYCREAFITNYLYIPLSFPDDLTKSLILVSDEYEVMPVYPADGSIQVIEGCAVVKFSHMTFSDEDKAAVRRAAGREP